MLFNSYEFLFVFFPLTLTVYSILSNLDYLRIAMVWLVAASLFFYAWWNPAYLALIITSIIFNYAIGTIMSRQPNTSVKKIWLLAGIGFNLGGIAYFKYWNFFLNTAEVAFDTALSMNEIVLPLAISFFTFQQITYLVDSYRGEVNEHDFLHYCLFVTFFPQLIAGPIVHHKEMMPQFVQRKKLAINYSYLSLGSIIFLIGLFKKVVFADSIAAYANPVFNAADMGETISFFEAWGGSLAYTFQLYFDFSGYSDMAIGAALMFGIRLPINFNSPYKSHNIVEFWRRWHMTLSRFLKDYVYIPLGGNRCGKKRKQVNLLLTMLIGGLWHGAGWTFVFWGGLHGVYLIINYIWSKFIGGYFNNSIVVRTLSWFITFNAVVVAWVFFRAETFQGAIAILQGMVGINGAVIDARLAGVLSPFSFFIKFEGSGAGVFGDLWGFIWILTLFSIAIFLPNTQSMINVSNPNIFSNLVKSLSWAFFGSALLFTSLISMSQVSDFLYFNF